MTTATPGASHSLIPRQATALWWLKWFGILAAIVIVVSILAKVVGSHVPTGSGFGDKKTIEFEVNTLQDQKLCGVPSGERTYTIPHEVHVLIGATSYNVTSYIRINSTVPKEKLEVKGDCVTVSFAFIKSFKDGAGKSINPQIIPIAFE